MLPGGTEIGNSLEDLNPFLLHLYWNIDIGKNILKQILAAVGGSPVKKSSYKLLDDFYSNLENFVILFCSSHNFDYANFLMF